MESLTTFLVCYALPTKEDLLLSEDADDNQQVAGEAKHGGNDNSTGGEDVGIEGLLRATRARHQQVADDYQDTGCNQDATTGQYGSE